MDEAQVRMASMDGRGATEPLFPALRHVSVTESGYFGHWRPIEWFAGIVRPIGSARMMMKRHIALCLAVVAALAGASPANAELITGAGSTFAFPILGQWAKAYRVAKTDGADFIPHDIGVDYEPIGSLGGEVRINQRGIDFGATDRPLPPAELERNGLGQFPIVMGGVVPVVNIDGVTPGQVKLTGALLAEIFLGKITNWSDPGIKAINPELTLPDAKIMVVHRSDGSGTTFNFASYLAKVSTEWRDRIGADTVVKWPTGTGAEGNHGVANLVLRTKNAIGYVEYGQVIRAALAYALVQNRIGGGGREQGGDRALADFEIGIDDQDEGRARRSGTTIIGAAIALVACVAQNRCAAALGDRGGIVAAGIVDDQRPGLAAAR